MKTYKVFVAPLAPLWDPNPTTTEFLGFEADS
jgi:hypothetical protein